MSVFKIKIISPLQVFHDFSAQIMIVLLNFITYVPFNPYSKQMDELLTCDFTSFQTFLFLLTREPKSPGELILN